MKRALNQIHYFNCGTPQELDNWPQQTPTKIIIIEVIFIYNTLIRREKSTLEYALPFCYLSYNDSLILMIFLSDTNI